MVYKHLLFEIVFYNNVLNFKRTGCQVKSYYDVKPEKLPIASPSYYCQNNGNRTHAYVCN